MNLCISLKFNGLWDESKSLARDQLLPAARRFLGPDDAITLGINQNLAYELQENPKHTRDDLLESETILRDVVTRRRRVFGPAHPDTRGAEDGLSNVRLLL